jgi:hypothetical protein
MGTPLGTLKGGQGGARESFFQAESGEGSLTAGKQRPETPD